MGEPPTREQLAGREPLTLDGLEVVRNFLGKTQADARRMFSTHRGFSTEDFMWMAAEGLKYYLRPALEYLIADESKDDFEFCHGLLCSLAFQAQQGNLSTEAIQQIREIADFADANRAKFVIDPPDSLFDEDIREIRKASG